MTVIGEAANFIPEDIRQAYPQIPWDKMRGFRNIVVHKYFSVSLPLLWQTTQTNLPPLVENLEQILAEQRS